MASSRPGRRTSLPPELDAIDSAWSEEEEPTRPDTGKPSAPPIFPSEAPTVRRDVKLHLPKVHSPRASESQAASKPTSPSERETLPPDEDEEDEEPAEIDIFDRPTLDQDAISKARAAPVEEEEPRADETAEPQGEDRVSEVDLSGFDAAFNLSPGDGEHPSSKPTAPPPKGFSPDRMRTVPREEQPIAQDTPASQANMKPPPSAATGAPAGDSAGQPEAEPSSERSRVRDLKTQTGAEGVGEPSDPHATQLRAMNDHFAMGDFSGALESAEDLLAKQPENLEAKSMAAKCRDVLHEMYASRIGGFEQVVKVTMAPDQIRWLSLDHRAGFLLSMIDGMSTVDDLLDVCGMPRLDAMRILCNLLDQKVVSLSSASH